mmetsp:Transcript_19825/g.28753  ORF Transcript_19825/g.28753 Transcript_19825/m.28753 type:complete len:82 (-) Transcript_19825:1454-1699(-)
MRKNQHEETGYFGIKTKINPAKNTIIDLPNMRNKLSGSLYLPIYSFSSTPVSMRRKFKNGSFNPPITKTVTKTINMVMFTK